MKRILNGAKALYSNGLDVYYTKKGGYATAIDDFRSLQPETFKVTESQGIIVSQHMSLLVGKPTMWLPNRSDTNRHVQAQKRARSLKFWI